jgi:hypothetical protein
LVNIFVTSSIAGLLAGFCFRSSLTPCRNSQLPLPLGLGLGLLDARQAARY